MRKENIGQWEDHTERINQSIVAFKTFSFLLFFLFILITSFFFFFFFSSIEWFNLPFHLLLLLPNSMAVELLSGFTNAPQLSSRSPMDQDSAVQEAASGLDTLKKLVTLLSHSPPSNLDSDCQAVANAAVSHFRKAISLLGRSSRTGHARFRRAPLDSSKIYNATPIQQIPPPSLDRLDSATTINFSYSTAPTSSFLTSLPASDSEIKLQHQPSSSSFQITDLSRVSSVVSKPSSGLKRKCGSENLGSGKCAGSSGGRCHCSKKR